MPLKDTLAQCQAKGLWVLGGGIKLRASRHSAGTQTRCLGLLGSSQTNYARGVCEPALKPRASWEGGDLINGVQSRDQNRIWEIRPSGIAGRLRET